MRLGKLKLGLHGSCVEYRDAIQTYFTNDCERLYITLVTNMDKEYVELLYVPDLLDNFIEGGRSYKHKDEYVTFRDTYVPKMLSLIEDILIYNKRSGKYDLEVINKKYLSNKKNIDKFFYNIKK